MKDAAFVSATYNYDIDGAYMNCALSHAEYYGEKLNNRHFNLIRSQKVMQRLGFKILELHFTSAVNRASAVSTTGEPKPGFGKSTWGRIVVAKDDQVLTSDWTYHHEHSSAADCALHGLQTIEDSLINDMNGWRTKTLESLHSKSI